MRAITKLMYALTPTFETCNLDQKPNAYMVHGIHPAKVKRCIHGRTLMETSTVSWLCWSTVGCSQTRWEKFDCQLLGCACRSLVPSQLIVGVSAGRRDQRQGRCMQHALLFLPFLPFPSQPFTCQPAPNAPSPIKAYRPCTKEVVHILIRA